ncbi:MAG: NifU family protein [Holophagales bacterium]|jgi:Fe-S cluster biogenesis protein NfuA|nr:NifU family protein [Holophagales bacterium]
MPKVVNIEPTPNPDALKFVVKEPLLAKAVRSFQDFASAVGDPLGSAIFALGNVTSVFYMDRFVTVNKHHTADWAELIDPICDAIEDCRIENATTNSENNAALENDGTLQKIIDVVDSQIRPGLAGDGGGLDVISFDGKILTIAYQGACGSCPAAGTGTLQFIEGLLQHEVDPSIKVVMS